MRGGFFIYPLSRDHWQAYQNLDHQDSGDAGCIAWAVTVTGAASASDDLPL
jgi:hypothetical protein